MDKIKAFFQNKITKIVAWIVFFLDAVVLFLGGTSAAELNDGVKIIAEIFGLAAVLVAFIAERVSKKK